MSARADALDLFCGIGWAEGMAELGMTEFGIDREPSVSAAREANGHHTLEADLSDLDPRDFRGVAPGLVASPPCQDDSQAGRRTGRDGERGRLTDLVPRWVKALDPEWIACEQVPEVLSTWRQHAHLYRQLGYHTWVGELCAADYGVPQVRRRAFLLASKRGPVAPAEPTHSADAHPGLFVDLERWVTMADALGWVDDGTRPAWCFQRPATTVCGDPRIGAPGHRDRAGGESQFENGSVRVTVREALTLQSFTASFELAGPQTQQYQIIGNAVPPRLARHVIAAAAGLPSSEQAVS